MFLAPLARTGGIAVLTLGLAACMDVSMDIEVLSQTEARATMVTAMDAEIYAMINAQAEEGEDDFCEDGEVVETPATVECVVVTSGPFDDLGLEGEDGGPEIVAIGNGQVRVSFPTGELAEQVAEGTGGAEDPEMMAMIASMFEGNFITMTVSGGRIVETNMEIAADGLSASYQIPFTGILLGDLDLPETLFAVVQK